MRREILKLFLGGVKMTEHDMTEVILKRVEKILMSVPAEAVTTNTLAKIAKMSTPTVQKWVDIISYIQNHYIKIEVIKTKSGSKEFRQIRRTK